MTDDGDEGEREGLLWTPNLLENLQSVSETATRQQQEALQQVRRPQQSLSFALIAVVGHW